MQGRTLTTTEKEKFIKKLKLTGGNISKACQLINLARSTVYDHKKESAEFAAEWEEAIEYGVEQLEEEARRRALRGVKKTIFYKGEPIGIERQYSDTLLIFLLKGKKPDVYRERYDIDTTFKGSLDVSIETAIDKIYNDDESED